MQKPLLALVVCAGALLAIPLRVSAQAQVTPDLVSQSTGIFKGGVEKSACFEFKNPSSVHQTILVRVEEIISVGGIFVHYPM